MNAAPFDHLQLSVTSGHVGNGSAISADGYGRGLDELLVLPLTGCNGYAPASVPKSFLDWGLPRAPTCVKA